LFRKEVYEFRNYCVKGGEKSKLKSTTLGRRIITILPVLFLLMDGVMKLFKPAFVVEPTLKSGYPESTIVPLGVVLIACTILYVIPRTSILGAILLTGYLGGAVATNVRISGPAFNILFPLIVAALLWTGISLREPRLRMLLPFKK